MHQFKLTIVGKEKLNAILWRFVLHATELPSAPQPGQFLLLRCADRFTCYLRRPIYPIPLDAEQLLLLVQLSDDPGLAWLLAQPPGTTLEALGPLGQGFPPLTNINNLLLVSDTPMITPLLGQLQQALAAEIAVTLLLGSARAATLYPLQTVPPEVELHIATLDGSQGSHGPITQLTAALLPWADRVVALGSSQLYRALVAQQPFVSRADFLYGLVAPPLLPCGVGSCYGCAVATQRGFKRACVAGPVFDLTTL